MPAGVMFAKCGSVFTLTGEGGAHDILATFRTAEIRITQDSVEHSGPRDDFVYRTPRRSSATVTATVFVTGAGEFMLDLIPTDYCPPTAVGVECDLVDGRSFTGDFHVTEVGGSASDDPNECNVTLESDGPWSILPS